MSMNITVPVITGETAIKISIVGVYEDQATEPMRAPVLGGSHRTIQTSISLENIQKGLEAKCLAAELARKSVPWYKRLFLRIRKIL